MHLLTCPRQLLRCLSCFLEQREEYNAIFSNVRCLCEVSAEARSKCQDASRRVEGNHQPHSKAGCICYDERCKRLKLRDQFLSLRQFSSCKIFSFELVTVTLISIYQYSPCSSTTYYLDDFKAKRPLSCLF